MPFMTLDCGRRVSVDAFEFGRTYAGLMEGRSNARLNASIIQQALAGRISSWGQRHMHLIAPQVNESDPEHPCLPPVLLRAWLTCYEPIDPAFMASHLVVVWFTEECHTKSIESIVFEAVRGLEWEKLAEDFDW